MADTTGTDQVASVYARWVMPRSHSEVYVEFGRTDHNWAATDFALEPDHYRAYIAGFRKLIPFNPVRNEYLDVQVELTKFSRTLVTSMRVTNNPGAWYTHHKITHGYTHNGQVLGSGIGISSNMQWVSIGWVRDRKKLGLELYRLAHDEDFWAYVQQTLGYGDYRTHWVDLSGALVADWDVGRWLFSARLQGVAALNYLHLYEPLPGDSPFWWDKGKVRWNVVGELTMVYEL